MKKAQQASLDHSHCAPSALGIGDQRAEIGEVITHGELTTGNFVGWTVIGKSNSHVADIAVRDAAFAPRVVRAVNCHDDMLAACRSIQAAHSILFVHGRPLEIGGKPIDHSKLNEAANLANAAISKAESL